MQNNHLDDKVRKIEQGIDALKNNESKISESAKDKLQGEKAFAEIVGGLIFGVVFGLMLDKYFNTKPLFLIIFVILGLAGSIYSIYKAAVKSDIDDKR